MKKTAIVCIISMLVQFATIFGIAAAQIEYNAELLEALGVCTAEVADKEYVTRGEFAEYIVNIYTGGKTRKSRMECIEFVLENGFMDNSSTGEFEPDIAVRNDVAAKAAVELLGCGFKAETAGDYWKIASQMKLVGGMAHYEMLSGSDCAALLSRIIDADAYVFASSGGSSTQFEVMSAAEAFFDIAIVKGTLTAVEDRSLTDSKTAGSGCVRIDNRIYEFDCNLADMLGLSIKAYVKIKDNIVIYAIDDSRSKVVIPDNIINRERSSLAEIAVDDGNRIKTYRLAGGLEVIINNDGYLAYTIRDLIPDYGSITLVDNNGDGRYDVAKVESFITVAVNYVEITNKSIGDFYGNNINELSELESVEVIRDGKSAMFGEIMQDDVAGVAIDKEGNHAKIVVTSTKLSGRIDEADEEGITVDGVLYEFAPSYEKLPSDKKTEINVGDTLMATLDMYGRIAYIKRSNSVMRYGYMINAYITDEDERLLKIFTDEGQTEKLTVSNKAKIDGVGMFNRDVLLNVFSKDGSTIAPQLIKYRVNDNNIVTGIYSDKSGKLSRDFDFMQRSEASGSRVFSDYGDFVYNASTVIFSVPDPSIDSTEEDYAIVKKALDSVTAYDYTQIAAYDVDDFGVAKAVVSRTTADLNAKINADVKRDTEILIVTKINETVDDNGDPVIKLCGIDRSSEKEYYIRPDKYSLVDGTGSLPKIRRGDAIMVLKDFVTDYVIDIIVINGINETQYSLVKDKITSGKIPYYEVLRGKVHNRLGAMLRVSAEQNPSKDSDYKLYPASGATVFVVDDGNARYGNMGEIRVGDEVLIRARASVVWEVIIYR